MQPLPSDLTRSVRLPKTVKEASAPSPPPVKDLGWDGICENDWDDLSRFQIILKGVGWFGPRAQGPRVPGPKDQGPRDRGPRDQDPRARALARSARSLGLLHASTRLCRLYSTRLPLLSEAAFTQQGSLYPTRQPLLNKATVTPRGNLYSTRLDTSTRTQPKAF